MSKTIGVDPNRVFGLQEEIVKRARIAWEKNDVQFIDALEALSKANYQQRETFIEEVLKRKSSVGSFIVGEVFQNRIKGLVPQYFGSNFKTWLWEPAQTRVVSINAFGKNNLKKYVLPKNMNDTAIQNATNSTPMEEDAFWVMLFLLIINPKLGKKILKYELQKNKVYIFHVKLASGRVVAVRVGWGVIEWSFSAGDFGFYDLWDGGNVFLFPANIGN